MRVWREVVGIPLRSFVYRCDQEAGPGRVRSTAVVWSGVVVVVIGVVVRVVLVMVVMMIGVMKIAS